MRYRSYDNGANYFWSGLFIFLAFGGFKTLFLLLPLLSFAPIFIFGYLGYKVIKTITSNNTLKDSIHGASNERLHYVELMIQLMVHAIHADGKVDQRELQAIISFFQTRLRFSTKQLYWVQDLLQHAMRQHASLPEILNSMNNEFNTDEKRLAVELLIAVLVADDDFSAEEQSLLDKVTQRFGIDPSFYSHLKQRYKTQSTSHYDILGVA